MNTCKSKLIVICFVFSIICTVADLTDCILRIVYDLTGIGLSAFNPNCTQIYFASKFGFTYLSLLAEFFLAAIATICSIVIVIALIGPIRALRSSSQAGNGPAVDVQQTAQKLKEPEIQLRYQLLYILGSLQTVCQIVAGGKAIQFLREGKWCTTLYYKSVIAGVSIGCFVMAVTLLILILLLIAQREELRGINLQELKKNSMQEEEQMEIGRRIEGHVKDYLKQMLEKREEIQKQLVGEQENFGESPFQKYFDKNSKAYYNPNPIQKEESEYTYEEISEEEQEQGDQFSSQKPSQEQNQDEVDEDLLEEDLIKSKTEKKEKQRKDSSSNPANSAAPPISPKQPKKRKKTKNKDGGKHQAASSSIVAEEPVKNQEKNVDQKEKPDENRQTPLNLTEENSKLLKTAFFDNTSFGLGKQPPLQEECPILKYLERDEKEEIAQNDFKFKGKNKRNLYQKEQLVFSKKRKDVGNLVQCQFNQLESIKEERLKRFGEEWVKEREVQETLLSKELSDRFKKRQGLQSIRSKFYH